MRVTDQCGFEFELNDAPQRIVSLVPSQTELLFDLGLGDRVVGITKFCVHPEHWRREKTIVGGTKAIHHDRIKALQPDLIIANKEENTEEDVLNLRGHYPVWTSDVVDLDSALDMIQSIGMICGVEKNAAGLVHSIVNGFSALPAVKNKLRVLYLIWKNPFMVAGRNTFIQEMLDRAGFENAIEDPLSRYPELTEEDIEDLNPGVLLLSSEPFPFKGKHTKALKARFPNMRIVEVDGEAFSWYGSRLLRSPKYFATLRRELKPGA